MSTRRTIKKQEDVELSEDGKTLEVLYEFDYNGNNYIDIPIEFVQQALPPQTEEAVIDPNYWSKCPCCKQALNKKDHNPPQTDCRKCGKHLNLTDNDAGTDKEVERLCDNCLHPPQTDELKGFLIREYNKAWSINEDALDWGKRVGEIYAGCNVELVSNNEESLFGYVFVLPNQSIDDGDVFIHIPTIQFEKEADEEWYVHLFELLSNDNIKKIVFTKLSPPQTAAISIKWLDDNIQQWFSYCDEMDTLEQYPSFSSFINYMDHSLNNKDK